MRTRLFMIATCAPLAASAYDDAAIIEQCDAEWGTDFEMVAYCREQQRAAGRVFDDLQERAAGGGIEATMLNGCIAKWGNDYEMVIYCYSRQESALRSLATAAEDIPADTATVIRAQCDAEWGDDFEMVTYCVEQQSQAWRSLQ